MIKRLIMALVILSMMTSMAVPISAYNGDTIQPRWDYINTVTANLTIDETLGIATATGRMIVREYSPVEIIVRLQRSTAIGWVTIATWNATGTRTVYCSSKYAVEKGFTYRVTVSGYLYDADGALKEDGFASYTVAYPSN